METIAVCPFLCVQPSALADFSAHLSYSNNSRILAADNLLTLATVKHNKKRSAQHTETYILSLTPPLPSETILLFPSGGWSFTGQSVANMRLNLGVPL